VIFVDDKTLSPSDFGSLIRALQKLWEETVEWDWGNRIVVPASLDGGFVVFDPLFRERPPSWSGGVLEALLNG
jgi:hypothetical protein